MAIAAKEFGLLPARVSLGATMLHHGWPKLGGEGLNQASRFFEQLGLKPARTWARLAGVAEVLGGASTLLGIGTRLGALAVIVTQGVAIATVHRGKGFSNLSGGWEFNALIIAAALGLLVAGPGTISAHELVEHRVQGGARWLFEPRRRRGASLVKLLK